LFTSFLFSNDFGIATPVNDECVNAIELTDLSTCEMVHIDAKGATSSNRSNSCDNDALDVWYRFTATSSRLEVRGLEFSDYGSNDIDYEIYTDGCAESPRLNNGCRGLMEDDNHTWDNLILGEEYYLRIWFNLGQEADICLAFLCDVSITSHFVTICDGIENTYDLQVEVSANNLDVGDSLVLSLNYGREYADNGLKIVTDTASFTFNVTNLTATGEAIPFSIREWNGSCEQYFYEYYTAPNPCVNPPINDDCENAIELTNLSNCDTLHLDARGATSSDRINSCNKDALDIWYKFTATSTRLQLRGLEFSDYGSNDIVYEIYTDGCIESTRINNGCTTLMEGESDTWGNLIAGEEYYLQIWFNSGQEADICLAFLCDFAINSHTVTVCDNIDNTYDLEVELSGSNLEVGDSLIFFYNYFIPAENGFKIEQENANYTFNLADLPATGNPVVLSVRERNGGCEGRQFYNFYTAPSPCVNSPVNDECSNAIEIADLTVCDTVHVSVAGATSSNLGFECGPEAVDVWYKFTAESSGIQLEWIEFSDYRPNTRIVYEIYTDSCNPSTRLNNSCYQASYEGGASEIKGLTVGNEYYIRMWFDIGQAADFCLKSICSIDTNPIVSICNIENNTYDLNIETNGYGLTVGDTLVLDICRLNIELEQQITSSNSLYNFRINDLPTTGAQYGYSIRQKGSDCWESSFYNAPLPCVSPPTNDNCSNAIEVSDLSVCDTIHINTYGATSEFNVSRFVCKSSRVDVWYKFTAISSVIRLNKLESSDYVGMCFEVYASGCERNNRLNDSYYSLDDRYGSTVENLITGQEYYIRIWMSNDLKFEGDICIKSPCTFISGAGGSICDNGDNTYSFGVQISATGLEVGDSLVLLFDNGRYATYDGLKITNSTVDNHIFSVGDLPSTGNNVSFSIFEWNGGCNDTYVNFYRADEPCVDSPENDNCLAAIEITNLNNCNLLHPNTFGATSNDLTACGLSVIDVWYQFTATASSVNFGHMNTNYSNTYGSMKIEVYSGSCSNLESLDNTCYALCDTCDFTLDNLVAGEKYYIRASSGETYEADFCIQNANIDICKDTILNLNTDIINQATYQTTQTITASGKVLKEDSTTLKSAISINLLPGFAVEAGGKFLATIEDCTPNTLTVENPTATTRRADEIAIAKETSLPLINDFQISPNPFYQSTTIKYNLPKNTKVNLQIFSMNGSLIQELVPQQWQTKGNYEYLFEPTTNSGNIYFAVLTTAEEILSKKLIFIR